MVFMLVDLPDHPYQNRYVYIIEEGRLVYINLVVKAPAILTDDAKRQIITYYSAMYEPLDFKDCLFYGYSGMVKL